MISVENRAVEVVEPASPPHSEKEHHRLQAAGTSSASSPPASPEIRVTDTPEPSTPGSPNMSTNHSFRDSSPMSNPSPMASPTIPTPQMLFQPFLPAGGGIVPGANMVHPHPGLVGLPGSTTLPFSIDNILKPTFGHRLSFIQSVASLAAAQQVAAVQQQAAQQQQQKHTLQKLSEVTMNLKKETDFLGSSTSGSPVSSPRRPSSTSVSNNNNNNQPVDLSSSQLLKNGGGGGDSSGEEEDASSTFAKDAAGQKPEKDGECPPGMVRGPNGQLWPAWVFCTRYSDRPSSGKSLLVCCTFLSKYLTN